ncbi:hypothetical protein L6164_037430 [Bauhinia variegata]|uniref:Uncharacterized protein n=1 Tax=Bauhinia variegata TaxID=167791 RepID=A0ACB9KK90_BAUVA|nr:hypothetical protein L6164_037430 [Bauhinia variegata]
MGPSQFQTKTKQSIAPSIAQSILSSTLQLRFGRISSRSISCDGITGRNLSMILMQLVNHNAYGSSSNHQQSFLSDSAT